MQELRILESSVDWDQTFSCIITFCCESLKILSYIRFYRDHTFFHALTFAGPEEAV